jgi:predicted HicB family RNase H-like nuclease
VCAVDGVLSMAQMGEGRVILPAVPRGEPKVMFAVRLPGHLVEQVIEKAREEGVSRADVVERALELYLEDSRQ